MAKAKEAIIHFKPQARILLQLGDQLIRSESIAVLELIKNSYDACASKVTIRMSNLESKEDGQIIIEDDGAGMDYTTLRDVWLHPGTTFKKNQLDGKNYKSSCGRVPLGEKGIGRFGVHKLGESIELISKRRGKKEAYLSINWKQFDNDKLLDQVPIDLSERAPEVFQDGTHGTKIIIKNIRNTWSRGSVRELYRAITALNSPFEPLNTFKVLFKIDRQEWLEGLLKFKDVKESALFSASATIEGNEIKVLKYEFTPWPSMKKLRKRVHTEAGILMCHKVYDEKQKKKVLKDIDLSNFYIGKIEFKLLIFDLDTNVLSLGVLDKKGLREYLKSNGGIRVYRDGIRVYDYGEPNNDWLGLDSDRVNYPTARISNNIVIGSVLLERIMSKDLVEKTNREGFIDNDAYKEFHSSIRFILNRIITQRNIDKDKIRNYYSGKSRKTPIVDNLEILKEKVAENLPANPIKDEILGMISEISEDYKTMSEVYIRSASAGLSLSIVIHEIEKIIQELLLVVDDTGKNDKNSDRIKSLTWHLGKLIDGYSGLIRRRSRQESDLKSVVSKALWNIEFRLKAHEIHLVKSFQEEKTFKAKIRCSEGLIIGTIVNIIDNSIWWLNYGRVQNKKIFIDISDELSGYLTLLIADNGPGFNLPVEEIIKPFISNKDGGIGIGLHIADEVMKSHGGELLFPDSDEFTLPKEFKQGAIVALAFKTE